jgi:hypothetical protein
MGKQEGIGMFECERCGSSYSASHLGVEHCPRCQLRDQVQSPLAFKAFSRLQANPTIEEPSLPEAPQSLTPAPAEAG